MRPNASPTLTQRWTPPAFWRSWIRSTQTHQNGAATPSPTWNNPEHPSRRWSVPLEVVSDETLRHASIRVTMDVYDHLLAPARMKAAEAMRKALWIEEMPDFNPLATELATERALADPDDASEQGLVGRPGLDPGTLGLKVPCSSG